jgi:NAD(P)-dependent dehydrogenase (short-subunit alcohol dehydrogenase family)
MRFDGKLIAVTGGNGNLGRTIGALALQRGARVALLDLAFPSDAPPSGITRHPVDLLDAAATRATLDALGPVDVLCNVAGGFAMGTPVHETGDAAWTRLFDLNVRTLLNASRATVPGMLARSAGRIVNIGAAAALAGLPMMGAYCAAKAVVIRLTESMAAELKDRGINVNCVLPSIIDTPQNRADMPDADHGAWVSPDQLAEVILFLASDAASALHGAALPVRNRV